MSANDNYTYEGDEDDFYVNDSYVEAEFWYLNPGAVADHTQGRLDTLQGDGGQPASIPAAQGGNTAPENVTSTRIADFFEEPLPDHTPYFRQHHDGRFYCQLRGCDEHYRISRDCRKHYKRHFRPVHCPEPTCELRCAEQRDMERHVQNAHPSIAVEYGLVPGEIFKCSECGKTVTNRRDNLKRHRRICPGAPQVA